jgi:hypothetical protein
MHSVSYNGGCVLETQMHMSLMILAILYGTWKTHCKVICQNGTVQMYAL